MTLRDLIVISTGNLWRMKLRTFLTISGVVIAIAAFVSMLSFGAGNQQYVTSKFEELGLFSTMQVYPRKDTDAADTSNVPLLDAAAIDKLSSVPGVNLAYPYESFSVRVKIGDSSLTTKAQALPEAAIRTRLFSQFAAGEPFNGDTVHQAILTDDLLEQLGVKDADSLIGRRIVLSVRVSSIDSGLAHILADQGETIRDRIKRIHFDSLIRSQAYRGRIIREEANSTVRRFLNGFLNARDEITDTLTVCGIMKEARVGKLRIESVIVPIMTARRFTSSGFSENPADMFAAMSSGTLFAASGDSSGKSYPQVTLDLDPHVLYKPVKDSIEAMGFRTFSYAEKFDEIRQFFFYFDLALGVVGLIALITASLGIVNTMVMSILERKREIGVLKSLGADEGDIRWLFLCESTVIGTIGSVAGILFGWTISRVASAVAHIFMEKQGIPQVELFALPLWLITAALAVGMTVSMIAGLYPASRAARVDPVEALRGE